MEIMRLQTLKLAADVVKSAEMTSTEADRLPVVRKVGRPTEAAEIICIISMMTGLPFPVVALVEAMEAVTFTEVITTEVIMVMSHYFQKEIEKSS